MPDLQPAQGVPHRVRVDGLSIAYDVAGDGRPAVVFLHGAFQDRSAFASQFEHLAAGHKVVSLDFRGHGQSDPPAEISVQSLTEDALAVVGEVGVNEAVLVGHSLLGAAVALGVAAERPELVVGVAMLDAVVLMPEPVRRQALGSLVPELETDRWLEALRAYLARTFDPADDPLLRIRVMSELSRTRPRLASGLFSSMFASDYSDAIRDLHCPLMYIQAKAPADVERLGRLRPDALIGRVVGSGHYLMLSVPDQVNAMLARFLEIIDRDRPAQAS